MICQVEAPIQTQATAQKRPETPMGITGINRNKVFLRQLTEMFTLYSAKTPREIIMCKIILMYKIFLYFMWIFSKALTNLVGAFCNSNGLES